MDFIKGSSTSQSRLAVIGKMLFSLFLATGIYTLLTHGVPFPRFLWIDHLNQLQALNPNRELTAKRVVLKLGARPEWLISGFQAKLPTGRETLNIGLVRIETDWKALLGRPEAIYQLRVKGLEYSITRSTDCIPESWERLLHYPVITCTPALPVSLWNDLAKAFAFQQPKGLQPSVMLEKSAIDWVNTQTGTRDQVMIDQFQWIQSPPPQDSPPITIAIRWRRGENSQVYLSGTADNHGQSLGPLKVEFTANWGGYPWSGLAQVEQLSWYAKQLESGLPTGALHTSGLRFYLKRDDDPDTHQAALSAGTAVIQWPTPHVQMQQAEWTYTHENANAWTFDLQFDPTEQFVSVQPATIKGSEAIPALNQYWHLPCQFIKSGTYLIWDQGWLQQNLATEPSKCLASKATPKPNLGKGAN